ncbi:MAG: DUF192 domain-containing protein [Myxococcales bacterium]|nr:DUF192 domain-containing protein [Myxococcales bacterium]MCB9717113.1 DUF192 domain-containing protein [Myxococcales bacterium]
MLVGLALLGAPGCEQDETCEEDVRAQVLDERVTLELGDETLEAELADEPTERERGWRHRRCDREGLLLVPDAPGELPIWGCGLTAPIDLHLLRDAMVVEVVRDLPPCELPCDACPVVGEGRVVDAVLETPAGALMAEPGAPVDGLP